MHDIVVDALGRIDAVEEAAAFDAVKPKNGYGRPRARPWQLESQILGTTIRQEDIPRLMTDELAKAAIVPGGVKAITKALNLATPKSLRDYAAGHYRMNYSTGLRFVRYLEAQRIEKEKAAPAGTGTTVRKDEATRQAASPDIVPQAQEEVKDMPVKKPDVKPVIRLESADEELSALREELRNAEEALEKEQKESAARLIQWEETQAALEEKTLEAADLRAKLKTRTDETADLREQINELNSALDTATAKLASVQGKEMSELVQEVEKLRQRIAHFEADDAACGPARVEELEDRLSRARDEHVRDLELIRDLTRAMMPVARVAC